MYHKKPEGPASYWLYGKHPVAMAIDNPNRIIRKVVCTKNSFNTLEEKLSPEKLKALNIEIVDPHKIDRIIGSREEVTHQGIAAEVEPLDEINIEDLYEAKLIVALDKITDPHNIGAIMRSAAAFGASALLTQEKNSPPENATIAKISAGSVEIIPYARLSRWA
jgi:23S rRNA (guanosine2251-2'-O)-methyltransferase